MFRKWKSRKKSLQENLGKADTQCREKIGMKKMFCFSVYFQENKSQKGSRKSSFIQYGQPVYVRALVLSNEYVTSYALNT